jgi:hypothetical protein
MPANHPRGEGEERGEEVRPVFTVEEARALLCGRDDCADHSPDAKSRAWQKLAQATQAVTAFHPSEERNDE